MVTAKEIRALAGPLPRTALVCARLSALDPAEMRELVLDAWEMVVPQKVIRAYWQSQGEGSDEGWSLGCLPWKSGRRPERARAVC